MRANLYRAPILCATLPMTTFKQTIERLSGWIGVERQSTTHGEKLISAAGAFVGIAAVWWICRLWLDEAAAPLLIASMGASAVLLFAVPHGILSQPWPLVGGHLLSALVGVACQQLWPAEPWTAPLAVAAAILAMYYLRCIHPPGGATALTAVIGGETVQRLGFDFVLFPVAVNLVGMLGVAVLFNYPFPWRRYPGVLARRRAPAPVSPAHHPSPLTHEDFSAALKEMNSLIDVSPEDLAEVFERATQHAQRTALHPPRVIAGGYYSNGLLGQRWSVRQVIDAADASQGDTPLVIYKIVAGHDASQTGICSQAEFGLWARFEVALKDGHWLRVAAAEAA